MDFFLTVQFWSKLRQTDIYIYLRIFVKFGVKIYEPKKIYEGPKLRYLHFWWLVGISVHGHFGGIKGQEGVGIRTREWLQ